MYLIDDWHDVLRVGVLCLSAWCLVTLLLKKRRRGGEWNTKTLDLWFALAMWSVAGLAITLQGMVLDRPFTPAVVFVTAAVMVTGKGLHKKGTWGGDS